MNTDDNQVVVALDDNQEKDGMARRFNEEVALLGDVEGNDEEWKEDTSPEAVAQRLKDLSVSGAVDKLLDDDDLQDPLEGTF